MNTPAREAFEKWAGGYPTGTRYTLLNNKSYFQVWQAALSAAPKAEWDAEGKPLNLLAAAKKLLSEIDWKETEVHWSVLAKAEALRKFIKDESCLKQ